MSWQGVQSKTGLTATITRAQRATADLVPYWSKQHTSQAKQENRGQMSEEQT
jgi:hypothetical protein